MLGKWVCDRLTEDADFGKKNHEAHFDLGGYVNKHLGHRYIEKPTHPKRVTVWWGFWFRGIIFFENERVEAVPVNGDRYRAMLNEFLLTKIEEGDIGRIWFQQNGATCHTAKAILDVCALFLKITLSAAELMSFRHFGAANWHSWGAVKKSITSISQIQLAL